jgi:hypothetical protein
MHDTDPLAAAERFRDLYQRWDGWIPLDDLAPYLAWYETLARPDKLAFRTRAALLVVRARRVANQAEARLILDRFRDWFPRSG